MLRAFPFSVRYAREIVRATSKARVRGRAGGTCVDARQITSKGTGSSSNNSNGACLSIPGSSLQQQDYFGCGDVSSSMARRMHSESTAAGEGRQQQGVIGATIRSEEQRVADLLWQLQNLGRSNDPRRSEEALRLLEDARHHGIKDVRVYNVVLRSLSGQEQNADIEEVVRQMREDGLQPDVHTYNYIIYGFAYKKDVSGAMRAYKEMLNNDVAPDHRTLSNLIIAHSWSNHDDMLRVLEKLREKDWVPSRAAYHSMIPAMRREENWQGIYDAMHAMKREGRAPNDASFAVAFWAARYLRDPAFAKMLLEMRNDAEYSPRHDFFVHVMLVLRDAGLHRELLGYWRQLVCVNGLGDVQIAKETFILALKSAVKTRAREEVQVILGMMQAQGIPPDDDLYHALVGTRNDVTSAVETRHAAQLVLDLERRSGVVPGRAVRMRLAVVFTGAKMYERAMRLFDAALEDNTQFDPDSKDKLALTMLEMGRLEDAKAVWLESTAQEKVRYRGATHQQFMKAAESLGDIEWAIELHEAGLASRRKTPRFHSTLVRMLAEADKLEEAVGVMKTLRRHGHPKLPQESYSMLCTGCEKAGNTELVVEVVQAMREGDTSYSPPPAVLGFVIKAFIKHDRSSEIIRMFEWLCAQNRQPDPECFALMADAAVEIKDRPLTAKYIDQAQTRGLAVSETALAFMESRDQDVHSPVQR